MTQQLRQQLKTLINEFVNQKNDRDACIDQIIQLFQGNDEIHPATADVQQGRRRSSIFDGTPSTSPAGASGRRRSSTYSEKGLVNNPNTVLYDNHNID